MRAFRVGLSVQNVLRNACRLFLFLFNECKDASTTRMGSQSTPECAKIVRTWDQLRARGVSRRPLAPREMHVDFEVGVVDEVAGVEEARRLCVPKAGAGG